MRTNRCIALFCLLAAGLMYWACNCFAETKVGPKIKLGGLFDISGPTNEIGAPFADGARDYIHSVNKGGGINGLQVELIVIDYQYDIQKSTAGFVRLSEKEDVLGIIGWGSVDTPLLLPKAEEKSISIISAAARTTAVVGKLHPYGFSIAGSYAEEYATFLEWIRRDAQKKGISKPKVAYLHVRGTRPDLEVLKKINAFERLGGTLEISELIDANAMSATSEMLRVKEKGVDYVICALTVSPTVLALKEARKLGFKAVFCSGAFSSNENMLDLTASANAEQDMVCASPVAFMNQTTVEGIKKIRAFTGGSSRPVQYVTGWVGAMALVKGLERAKISSETLTVEAKRALQNGLESIRNESMDGLTKPMTFTEKSHRGTKGFRLYNVNWKNKTFEELPGDFTVSEDLYRDLYSN